MADDSGVTLPFTLKALGHKEAADAASSLRGAVQSSVSGIVSDFAGASGAVQTFTGAFGPATAAAKTLQNTFASVMQSTSSLTASLTIAAGGIGATVAAVAALDAIAIKSVLSFTEYGRSIHDISAENGLAAQTVSTLSAATQFLSNVSLPQVNTAISLYLKNAAEAEHGTASAAKQFQRFGLDARAAILNPDQAARDLINHLAQIPNSAQRLDEAFKLAGRGGKALADVAEKVRELGGTFEGFQQQAREWGVILSEQDVEAADKFRNSMTILGEKVQGIIYDIGRGALPEVKKALEDITGKAGDNRKFWEQFGRDAGDALSGTLSLLSTLNNGLQEYLKYRREIQAILQSNTPAEAYRNYQNAANPPDPSRDFYGPGGAARGGGFVNSPADVSSGPQTTTEDAAAQSAKAASLTAKAFADSQRATQTAAETAYQKAVSAAKEAFAQTNDYNKFILQMKDAERDRWEARKKQFDAEREEIKGRQADTDEAEKVKTAELKLNAAAREQAEAQFNERIAEYDRERSKDYLAELQRRHRQELEILDAQHAEIVRREQRLAEGGQESYRTAQDRINAALAEGFRTRMDYLIEEQKAADGDAKAYEEITQRLKLLTEQAQAFKVEAGADVTDAVIKDLDRFDEVFKRAQEVLDKTQTMPPAYKPAEATRPRYASGPWVDPSTFTDKPPNFTAHIQAITAFKQVATSAFSGITQGFGQMLQAFLAGGNLSGKAFLAMAKGVIAGIAAQAAVKSLFELAEGFAAAANPITAPLAPMHFAAAKIYGLVAAIGAGVALAIPGGGSSDTTGGGSAAGSYASTGSPYASTGGSSPQPIVQGRTGGASDPNVIERSRTQLPIQPIIIHLESHTTNEPGTLTEHVVNVVSNDPRVKVAVSENLAADLTRGMGTTRDIREAVGMASAYTLRRAGPHRDAVREVVGQ